VAADVIMLLLLGFSRSEWFTFKETVLTPIQAGTTVASSYTKKGKVLLGLIFVVPAFAR
jgi:hypothetical protein